MLRLNLPKEPYWLDLPKGIRVKVHPLSTARMSIAQAYMLKEMREKDCIPENEEIRFGLMESLLIKALARDAITEWEGVLGPEGNTSAPVTHKTINDLMDVWFIGQDFWLQYTSSVRLLDTEGKDFGLVVDGTSGVGPATVEDAKPNNSPAAKAQKVQSQESTAPTSRMSFSRKKALKRGRS